ncbi:Protein kinase-like domain [Pseudocohnilembus persalinus]|uniref:non-specific serine/threonine protein kinase n=1 Tax=Pseudocohnilembus persalinus TaxID=266149 RepID=A0A0V0R726_PSEPJ|nr:Protein kinase-like domain [Pseudocohnilembus persalinus]|eukprot:KRX10284.1 Protein kinase-like domain [Pseudocohnilembus persalinus]
MGNQCAGKKKKNIKQKQKNGWQRERHEKKDSNLNSKLNIGKINQITDEFQSNILTGTGFQTSISREGTVTSYEDIRKIYYFQTQIIGHGQFGAVRLAHLIKDPERKFAIKTISKEKLRSNLDLLKVELEILKNLDHPNIIKFYETYQDQKFFHLVMEYCSGGELFERIVEKGHFSEKESIILVKKIFSAVNYLHQNKIIHRDLKPENFLYLNKQSDSEIKIIDFGLSKILMDDQQKQQGHQKQIIGTALYIAPEIIQYGTYDFSCDAWSLGVIIYILLSGQPPFKGKNNKDLFNQILNLEVSFPDEDWKNISDLGKDFVKKLLVKNPAKRMTIEQALNHQWLKSYKKKKCKNGQFYQKIDPQILNIMKNFRSVGKFKYEVLKLIVNSLTEQEIKNLRTQFRILDQNHTGRISIKQLRDAMINLGHDDADQDIQDMMKTFSLIEQAKTISYTQFIGACLDKNNFLTKERLYQIFQQFDLDNTGYITKENLKEVMARGGRKLGDQDLEDLINDFDYKNDKNIQWDEFYTIMTLDKDDDLDSIKQSFSNMDIQLQLTDPQYYSQFRKGNQSIKNSSFQNLGIEVVEIGSNQMICQQEDKINIIQPNYNEQSINNTNVSNQFNSNSIIKQMTQNEFDSKMQMYKVSSQLQGNTNGQYLQNVFSRNQDSFVKQNNFSLQQNVNIQKNKTYKSSERDSQLDFHDVDEGFFFVSLRNINNKNNQKNQIS